MSSSSGAVFKKDLKDNLKTIMKKHEASESSRKDSLAQTRLPMLFQTFSRKTRLPMEYSLKDAFNFETASCQQGLPNKAGLAIKDSKYQVK